MFPGVDWIRGPFCVVTTVIAIALKKDILGEFNPQKMEVGQIPLNNTKKLWCDFLSFWEVLLVDPQKHTNGPVHLSKSPHLNSSASSSFGATLKKSSI